MIIECICGKKKFEVNSDLIPNTGRTIQCGSCEKVWFFDPNKESLGYKLMMESYERAMKEYNSKLESWLAGEDVPGIDYVVVPDGKGGVKNVPPEEAE